MYRKGDLKSKTERLHIGAWVFAGTIWISHSFSATDFDGYLPSLAGLYSA